MTPRIPPAYFPLALIVALISPGWAQTRPRTQIQVGHSVRSERSAAQVATMAFLNGQTAAGAAAAGGETKPLTDIQVINLLGSQVPHHRIALLVQQRGVDFDLTDDYLEQIRLAGGDDELTAALRNARVIKPPAPVNPTVIPGVDPTAEARKRALIDQHSARGAAFSNRKQFAQAEQEYREAVKLLPDNSDLYASLAYVLDAQKKWSEGQAAARESLRLNPENPWAHGELGVALMNLGDLDGEIREERESIRLNPGYALSHFNLGMGYDLKHDWDGDIAEQRAALNLDPDLAMAHEELAAAYTWKKDWDAAIAQEREAIRLNPQSASAHGTLGVALGSKGEWPAARDELRIATSLDPQNEKFRKYYDFAVQRTTH